MRLSTLIPGPLQAVIPRDFARDLLFPAVVGARGNGSALPEVDRSVSIGLRKEAEETGDEVGGVGCSAR